MKSDSKRVVLTVVRAVLNAAPNGAHSRTRRRTLMVLSLFNSSRLSKESLEWLQILWKDIMPLSSLSPGCALELFASFALFLSSAVQ